MKLYISIDMEGMPGTFNWKQEETDRPAVRRCITRHVQNVLENVLSHPQASLLDEITIADSHSGGDNLDYSITTLDDRISLISGCPRPRYMMPDFSSDYDQVWLLGYHSGTGTLKGNMDHTYSNSRIHKIWINGKAMNEAMINSAYAGYFQVPVSLVTGDEALQQELGISMPWVEFVATKKAMAKFSAKNYSQGSVDAMVSQAVNKVLSQDPMQVPPYRFEAPLTLKIEFNSTSMADQANLMPQTKRLDGRTVEFTTEEFPTLFEAIMVLVYLAASVNM